MIYDNLDPEKRAEYLEMVARHDEEMQKASDANRSVIYSGRSGGSIVDLQFDPQDIKGKGLATDTEYLVAAREEISDRILTFSAGGGDEATQTYPTNINFTGSHTTGSSSSVSNSDIIVREDLHITVNSDGTITANFNENSGCL